MLKPALNAVIEKKAPWTGQIVVQKNKIILGSKQNPTKRNLHSQEAIIPITSGTGVLVLNKEKKKTQDVKKTKNGRDKKFQSQG